MALFICKKGGYMKKTVEEFMYPNEVLEDNMPYLEGIYQEDYGRKFTSTIKRRIDNTLYVFDSDPVVTMNFFKDREKEIHDEDFLRRIYREYDNYIKIKDMVHNMLRKKYYHILSSYFSVLPYPVREDILDLDIEAYSYQNIHKVKFGNDLETIRRQEDYCKECDKLGVKPLTNPRHIHLLLNEKEKLYNQENKLVIKNSRWGRRIIRAMKKYYPIITLDDIVTLLEKEYAAYTANLLDNNGIPSARIMYFPLLRNLGARNLDGIFYHENRHVIESTEGGSGLHIFRGKYYRFMNEIRTEKNSLLDKECFSDDFLWSTDKVPDEYYNLYAELFPYAVNFFEENREFLNYCAITGDFKTLEAKFGAKNLIEFEQFLNEMAKKLKKFKPVDPYDNKIEEANILVQKMLIKK